MNTAQTPESFPQKTLRLWPGVVAVLVQWLAWIALPLVVPEWLIYGVLGGVLGGGMAVVLWWLFFSRAPWAERIGVLIFIAIALFATSRIVHESIANGGMGFFFYLYAIPVACLALVCAAFFSRRSSTRTQWASIVVAILLGCGVLTLLRTGGVTGAGNADLHWRWTPTPEERLLAQPVNQPATPAIPASAKSEVLWPGFRGFERNSVVHRARIATDWSKSPPTKLWQRAVGPGWSSFAVQGDLFYTQEQRGNDEVVACYQLSTGQPVWSHRDATRFWESNAGAGPRATPTLKDGQVYTLGAKGLVNVLSAADGSVIWSRNAATDTGAKLPDWGFAGSPLVVDDLVIVATSGRLIAYDRAKGDPRWQVQSGGGGYSSPHLAMIDGVKQILLMNSSGVVSVAPDGAELWKYAWRGDGIVQPAMVADGEILLGAGSGLNQEVGLRRLNVTHKPDGWAISERWSAKGIRPYFNDYVLHKEHAYGFDNGILACIDLADGQRRWKGGRYGHGQLILLADQDLLLVLSEKGELALVDAKPDQHKELARVPAIDGKTWNHPVLVGDVLLVRNSEEMGAFRLSLKVDKN